MSSMCEVCLERPHKYRCPRCLLKTCCLACVKEHKAQNHCNGERDKTAYTSVKDFTDITLLSDYRFLEDAGRKADEASRDRLQKSKGQPRFVNKFLQQATRRGVSLKLMPYPFSKRRKNSSYMNFKYKCIMWHTEWVFPQAEAQYTQRVPEEDTLDSCLQNYIDLEKGKVEVRAKLGVYISAKRDDIKIFMRKADTPTHIYRYYEVPGESSITGCMKGRVVVEYPTFEVVLRDHWHKYTLADDKTRNIEHTESLGKVIGKAAVGVTVVRPQAVYPDSVTKATQSKQTENSPGSGGRLGGERDSTAVVTEIK